MNLYLSRLHFPVTTLGPGRRVGIWFQGCSIRCEGCVSADTWAPGRGRTTLEEVVSRLEPWLEVADGVTITGGEPFDQPDALAALLAAIRLRSSGDILLYSGYSMAVLQEQVQRFSGLVDALMSEPYDAEAGQTLALRGSDNQRLHLLTSLGEERFATYLGARAKNDPGIDLMFDDDGIVFMAGIPRPGDMERLRALLASCGHVAQTSEAR